MQLIHKSCNVPIQRINGSHSLLLDVQSEVELMQQRMRRDSIRGQLKEQLSGWFERVKIGMQTAIDHNRIARGL